MEDSQKNVIGGSFFGCLDVYCLLGVIKTSYKAIGSCFAEMKLFRSFVASLISEFS